MDNPSKMPAMPGMRILVVDDLKSVRSIITKLLTNLGHSSISQAANGEEALSLLRNQPFDLLITDWEMPKMTGIELLKHLRADNRFTALPVLLITSNSERSRVIEALNFGVSDFVAKPFSDAVLKNKIENVMSKQLESPKTEQLKH